MMNIDNVVFDFDVVANYLKKNSLVKLAKKTLEDRLDTSEVSQEEKDRLLIEFDKQLSLLLLPETVKLSFSFPLLVKQAVQAQSKIDVTTAQKDALAKEVAILAIEADNEANVLQKQIDVTTAQKDTLAKEVAILAIEADNEANVLQKQIDVTIAQKDALAKEVAILALEAAAEPAKIAKEIDILDKQAQNVRNNYKNKTMKSLTEMIALFAQNEVDPDAWIKQKIRDISSSLSGHNL